ncbi:MAG: DUF4390 domain-containing protein [Chromatiales bacterium]|nr:DUF4390 domain-containing protein [Chromatiales bacterium]
MLRPLGWLGLVMLWLAPGVQASDFFITGLHTEVKEGVYLLDADIDYRFTDDALQALSNGVPLTVQVNIEIERVRNWWFDAHVATLEQRYSLQYHALSHQYLLRNLNSSAFYSFPNYRAAVQAMGRLREFPLVDAQLIVPDESYRLLMKAELDIEALPSPLRPVAYITPAWRLKSDWYSWSLTH